MSPRQREAACDRLASLEAGGSPARAIEVASTAIIEGRATRQACPHCGGENRVHEHTRPVPGLRRVDVACRQCSAPRTLWYKLVPREPN